MQTSHKGLIAIIACCLVIVGSYSFYRYKNSIESLPPSAPVVTNQITLTDTPWVWQYTINQDGTKTIASSTKFILDFTKEGTLTSTTDCNILSATYEQNGEVISFTPFVSTKMFCTESQESLYRFTLALATSFTITGTTLTINSNRDAGVMTFRMK